MHVVPADRADPAEVAVDVAGAVQATAGLLPTQVVGAAPGRLPEGDLGRIALR